MTSLIRRGLVLLLAATALAAGAEARADSRPGDRALLLAVSWQPAFCETRPGKLECKSQTAARFDATHFALHGLWPQPRGTDYCGVAPEPRRSDKEGRWADLPALDLSAETRTELKRVMPGTRSFLHRHEWIKHGSCYAEAAERYFRDSLALMDGLNRSGVRGLFADNIGRRISADQVRAAFAAAFGAGAGRRVKLVCGQDGARHLIVELRINLMGPVTPARGLAALIGAAPEVGPGCAAGMVDPAGLQ